MHIELDDLSRPEVHVLLHEHLSNMASLSPAESVHALDPANLLASNPASAVRVFKPQGCGQAFAP